MTSPQVNTVIINIPGESDVPLLPTIGKIEGRKVSHIPVSHSGSEKGAAIKSKGSKIANSLVCVMCLGLIIGGAVMHGTMNDACNNQRSDCNPTLRTAGMGMWIAGVSIIGLQCCIVGVALCVAGAAAAVIIKKENEK